MAESIGPRGPQGLPGRQGSLGARGVAGVQGPRGLQGTPGAAGGVSETATGSIAIPAGALIKASSTAGRYALWLSSDSPLLIVGCAVTACSGAAASFTAQFVPGTSTVLLSDGTGTIAVAAPIVASGTVDGRVKQGLVSDTGFLGFNVGSAVAATLDASVTVR